MFVQVYLKGPVLVIKMILMFLVIILFKSYISLGGGHDPMFSIRVPPTVLDSTEFNDTSCISLSTIDKFEKASRKKRDIINSYHTLRPGDYGGPGWITALHLNMSDHGNNCPSNWSFTENQVKACGCQLHYSDSATCVGDNSNKKYRLLTNMWKSLCLSKRLYIGI